MENRKKHALNHLKPYIFGASVLKKRWSRHSWNGAFCRSSYKTSVFRGYGCNYAPPYGCSQLCPALRIDTATCTTCPTSRRLLRCWALVTIGRCSWRWRHGRVAMPCPVQVRTLFKLTENNIAMYVVLLCKKNVTDKTNSSKSLQYCSYTTLSISPVNSNDYYRCKPVFRRRAASRSLQVSGIQSPTPRM